MCEIIHSETKTLKNPMLEKLGFEVEVEKTVFDDNTTLWDCAIWFHPKDGVVELVHSESDSYRNIAISDCYEKAFRKLSKLLTGKLTDER